MEGRTLVLTNVPFFIFALAGCLQSFHRTHAQLSSCTGKAAFSGRFFLIRIDVEQGVVLYRNNFRNKSDQLRINIT